MRLYSKGFTLIELLIVIAVLGILAVAVLSAINPIEQINRSKDTGVRSDAEQLINAIDRYYASNGYYPWNSSGNDTSKPLSGGLVEIKSLADPVVGGEPMLNKLSSGGSAEIKESFVTRITGSQKHLFIYNRQIQGDSTYVCWVPYSSAFRTEAYNRCKSTLPSDFPAVACPNDATCKNASDAGSATGCYSCLP
jgi:prepilin-type N-terminal cleavage/methylation domain-containing protein